MKEEMITKLEDIEHVLRVVHEDSFRADRVKEIINTISNTNINLKSKNDE